MIFSELYSVYYRTVAAILTRALQPGTTEKDLQQTVRELAFSESTLTILPALKSGRWPLLHADLTPAVDHAPTMPLTLLEKRWLRALLDDPRLKLFDVAFPDLTGVEPLFTRADYRVYDQYADGDPFEDETYIQHFRTLLAAVRAQSPVQAVVRGRRDQPVQVSFWPLGFEYSLKDDKLRVIADGCRYDRFNLGRILRCEPADAAAVRRQKAQPAQMRELYLTVTDERNALERAMLHFAHFEKQVTRLDPLHYALRLQYDARDETEMVIRVLAFGPCLKAEGPPHFVELVRDRLVRQKSCELK